MSGAMILDVDDLRFTLKRSARRRTLEISVERDGALVLRAPPQVEEARLREFIDARRDWIYRRLANKERLIRPVAAKRYIDGEGFLYLGRSHRLRLVEDQTAPLKLKGGRFLLRRAERKQAREHFVRWYAEHAEPWFAARVERYRARMEVEPAGVRVRELGFRWGSRGKGGVLNFHWKSALLPAAIAEYVVVHEMAHLHEPHHTPAFWQRVERAMPDYERRKRWLAEHGIEVEGI